MIFDAPALGPVILSPEEIERRRQLFLSFFAHDSDHQ